MKTVLWIIGFVLVNWATAAFWGGAFIGKA